MVRRESADVFDDSDAHIRDRARGLAFAKLEELALRLFHVEPSERSQTIIDVFLSRCEGGYLARMPLGITADAIKRRPALAAESAIWQRDDDSAVALLKTVIASSGFTHSVALGLLRSENWQLLYEAQHSGSRAWVRAAREFTNIAQPDEEIEEFILGRLWEDSDELHAELGAGLIGQFLKVAAAGLDVSIREAETFPVNNVDLPAKLFRLHDQGAELHACAFLLLVGLVQESETAACLMREGFSPIYMAAKEQRLPWNLWKRLETRLPWHVLDWDRCARLTEGVAIRFADRSWPPEEFFKTFATEEELSRAMDILTSNQKHQYLERLQATAVKNEGSTSFQRLGELAIAQGNLPEAARGLYDRALALFEKEQAGLGQANTLLALGDLERRLGRPDEARGLYDRALALFEKEQAGLGQANTLLALGDLEGQLGRPDEARGLYDRALALFEKEQAGLGQANTLLALGDLEGQLGRPDEARGLYDRALALFEKEQAGLGQANTLLALGDLEGQLGRPDEARGLYDRALALFEKEQAGLGQANTLLALGDLEGQLGRPDEARGLYDRALALFEKEQAGLGQANTLKAVGRSGNAGSAGPMRRGGCTTGCWRGTRKSRTGWARRTRCRRWAIWNAGSAGPMRRGGCTTWCWRCTRKSKTGWVKRTRCNR